MPRGAGSLGPKVTGEAPGSWPSSPRVSAEAAVQVLQEPEWVRAARLRETTIKPALGGRGAEACGPLGQSPADPAHLLPACPVTTVVSPHSPQSDVGPEQLC